MAASRLCPECECRECANCVCSFFHAERDALVAQLATVERERDEQRALASERYQEIERARHIIDDAKVRISELEVRSASAESANATLSSTLVEHSELNGHVDIVAQCRDYIEHEAMDVGDPSGKLRDFVESLRIVLDQFDRQRRSRNWHEAAYTAGKQKLIEAAANAEAERIAARLEQDAERLTKRGRGNGADLLVAGALYSHAADIRNHAWKEPKQ